MGAKVIILMQNSHFKGVIANILRGHFSPLPKILSKINAEIKLKTQVLVVLYAF